MKHALHITLMYVFETNKRKNNKKKKREKEKKKKKKEKQRKKEKKRKRKKWKKKTKTKTKKKKKKWKTRSLRKYIHLYNCFQRDLWHFSFKGRRNEQSERNAEIPFKLDTRGEKELNQRKGR